MNGYFNRPELNEERQAGGWHHTNDLGRIEVDGSLTFIGPKTRLIKSAAENIYPTEVEGCLKQHPAVADAAVIGVPDRTWGQNVTAVVVLREGAERDGRGDHRALPGAHRLVQEAQAGRVHRGPAAPAGGPSTTTPSTRATVAAATPGPGPEPPQHGAPQP